MKNVRSQVRKHVMDGINQAWSKVNNHVRIQVINNVNDKVLTQVGLQGNGQMRNQVLRNIKL
jgi:hypothetical protein